MGFEVYLECFDENKRTGISRSTVRALFPIVDAESSMHFWHVRYDANNSCDIGVTAIAAEHDRLKSLHVDRPYGDLRLWEGLISVLRMGSVVMFWPGGPLVVADENVAARIPKEMSDGMGKPKFVSSVEELLRLVRET
jgi:hypothetical protein